MYIYFCNQCNTSHIFWSRATNKNKCASPPSSQFSEQTVQVRETKFRFKKQEQCDFSPSGNHQKTFVFKKSNKKNWTCFFFHTRQEEEKQT